MLNLVEPGQYTAEDQAIAFYSQPWLLDAKGKAKNEVKKPHPTAIIPYQYRRAKLKV